MQKNNSETTQRTIIKAAVNQNQIGIVRTDETAPGVYIGSCLVEPNNFACPVSIINTTDNIIEMATPIVTLEDIKENIKEINIIETGRKIKNTISRKQQI